MKLKLRVIEESDLPQLRDWRNDDELRSTSREYRLLNLVNQHDWLDYVSRSREVEMFGIEVLVEIRDEGHRSFQQELFGVCGLCNINWVYRTAETSIYVAPDLQYPGVAEQALELLKQKAFKEFNLHRLWVEVYEFDTVKIALLEQCDFVLEGRLREHVFKQGRYHDSLMFGLLRRI